MKKLLFILTICAGTGLYAQRSNVESAIMYIRTSNVEDAKQAIDEAAVHQDTKNDVKMWATRAAVYDTIYRNPEYKKLDNNTEEKFITACLKCLETDVKKRYEYYCGYAVINAAFAAYNKAVEYYSANDPQNAVKFFQYVIDIFPYDKNGDLKKNNINEKLITKSIADLYYINKEYDNALIYYDKLIKMNYDDPLIFLYASNISFVLGDTTKGMTYVDEGRKHFATDKNLINQELNIYMAQGKQNVLIDKLNETLATDEENATLLFVRGNVYDNFATASQKQAKQARDTADILTKKARNEKVPANKTKLQNAAKNYNQLADSLFKNQKQNIALAEKDYLKVTEVNPENLDAYYNLGALNNNKTTEIVEKMNALNATNQADYDKKWNALKKVQDSILTVSAGYFMKALNVAETLPDNEAEKLQYKNATLIALYQSLQQVYANMGDEKKTIEMMNKRKELEAQSR